MYLFGILVGLSSILSGHLKIGLKRIIHPFGYWRYPVFSLVKKYLKGHNNLRALDIGSPKLLSLYLALRKGFEVFATDLQDSEIFTVWRTYYNDSKNISLLPTIKVKGQNLFNTEFQDARNLSYPDSYFDLVYSISVLEHIPGDGDTIASKEISRVLRSGGIAIIEVPFSNKEYDTYVNKDVYERKYIEKPVFYQRHYNGNTIYKRIINPTELFIERIVIVSEELPFELIMGKLNTFLQIPLLFISPILSIINHKKVELRVLNPYQESHRGKAKSIILFFKKL